MVTKKYSHVTSAKSFDLKDFDVKCILSLNELILNLQKICLARDWKYNRSFFQNPLVLKNCPKH